MSALTKLEWRAILRRIDEKSSRQSLVPALFSNFYLVTRSFYHRGLKILGIHSMVELTLLAWLSS